MNRYKRKYPEADYKSARDWHIFHVYNDPEFIIDMKEFASYFEADAKPVDEKILMQKYVSLAEKYMITRPDIYYFQLNAYERYSFINSPSGAIVYYSEPAKQIIIRADPNITRMQFYKLWRRVVAERNDNKIKATKRKPPDDSRLIYAIFKQRQKNVTFTEIYSMYQAGKLPLYEDGPTNQYDSKDKLERYYNSHKPDNFYSNDLA